MAARRSREVLQRNTELTDAELRLVICEELPDRDVSVGRRRPGRREAVLIAEAIF